jgi:membrane peptidoglycan carboxypeptidase
VAELSLSELMFLCAIPNNPTLYDPYLHYEDTLERRDSVMLQMVEDGKLSREEYWAACAEEIVLCPQEDTHNDYVETFAIFCAVRALMEENGFPFCYTFADNGAKDVYLEYYEESYAYWQKQLYNGGYRVYTSIDLEKQALLLETVQNQYLGGDTSLACSDETAAKVDKEVVALVKEAHEQARRILQENRGKLDEIAAYLLEKETISGEEFMEILSRTTV